jgi:DNA-binding GntR family transcriptional regulator
VAPNVARQEPPYQQIAEDIRRRIRSGELHDGDLVPSTRQLARDWDVSVPTASKALAALRSEGYVRGVVGTGTIVCAGETVHHSAADRLRAIARTGRIYPPDERAVITSAELVPAPDAVADAISVEPGAEVIRRHRITYRNDVPVSASTSWFPGELAAAAPLLLTAERIRAGTPGYIGQATGRAVAEGLDRYSAREATEQDAADLGVPVGSPVACGRNWYYDAEGGVIEYGESVSIPGRWTRHPYRVPRDGEEVQ